MEKIKISPFLFRTLDIRGAKPEYVQSLNVQPGSALERSAHGNALTPEIAYIVGRAAATLLKPEKVVLAHDARLTSPELSRAFIDGLLEQGVDVDFIGLATTDQLYFAVGYHKYDFGVMNTGSHTIKELNGFKISRYKDGRVTPVAAGSGMEQLKELALAQEFPKVEKRGTLRNIDIKEEFTNYLLSFFNYQNFKKQKIVFDAGNGTANAGFNQIIDKLPIEAIKLNFQPDGNFPVHEPDPMVKENIAEAEQIMKKEQADFGVCWDGDCDRVSIITPEGEILTGSFISPLLLPWVIKKHPQANVVGTPAMGWASREVAKENNASFEYAKVGNSYIKMAMEQYNAPFAAEEADHFMFAETFFTESGILPVLIILERITRENKSFDELLTEAKRGYFVSGDVNIEAEDWEKLLNNLYRYYTDKGVDSQLKFGDLQVNYDDWHFNIHPSLNDPVVRLNLEAKSKEKMDAEIANVKKIIDEHKS